MRIFVEGPEEDVDFYQQKLDQAKLDVLKDKLSIEDDPDKRYDLVDKIRSLEDKIKNVKKEQFVRYHKEDTFNQSFAKSTLMLNLKTCLSEKDYRVSRLQRLIPDDLVYHQYSDTQKDYYENPKDELGREYNSHITIAYGCSEKDFLKIKEVAQELSRYYQPVFTFTQLGLFKPNENYDVLKVGVKSDYLEELNSRLRKVIDFSLKYDYNPHMTIAYVKKDSANDLDGRSLIHLTNVSIEFNSLSFYLPSKECLEIEL